MKRLDLSGQKFGELTAIKFVEVRNGDAFWLFECSCGKKTEAKAYRVKSGHTKSCGCLVGIIVGNMSRKHLATSCGGRKRIDRLYNIWVGMKQRCENPNSNRFHRYGGRGIRVCSQWREDYVAFRDWALSNGYAADLQIDREDNNGIYEPSNCRWVTPQVQAQNRGGRFAKPEIERRIS